MTTDPTDALLDFHQQLEPFDPEARRRPIGQWPLTADDAIGLTKLIESKGLRLVPAVDAETIKEVTYLRDYLRRTPIGQRIYDLLANAYLGGNRD